MATTPDDGSLIQGGPGDQTSPAADARRQGLAGSQQGRPQAQEGEVAGRDTPRRPADAAAAQGAEGGRGLSDMERRAGTPDERATTDWTHGEGEPAATERRS